MVNISVWLDTYLQTLRKTFGDRVWFVGLQGSYSRGEATETSDIDTVAILDTLTAEDLQTYAAMLDTLPHRQRICGFLSGKKEILHWDTADLFQFYYDTTPILGSLDELLSRIDDAAVNRAIKMGAGNIYHGCVHNMLHDKNEEMLIGLYKSASFVVQAICFRQTGNYVRCQKDLLAVVSPEEQKIVNTFLHLKNGGEIDFAGMSEMLFAWAGNWIERTR